MPAPHSTSLAQMYAAIVSRDVQNSMHSLVARLGIGLLLKLLPNDHLRLRVPARLRRCVCVFVCVFVFSLKLCGLYATGRGRS